MTFKLLYKNKKSKDNIKSFRERAPRGVKTLTFSTDVDGKTIDDDG